MHADDAMTPRGQVLLTAAVAMIILLSMLGLAIDGGRGYWERREAQNAAELAALAAAWEHCHPATPGSADPSGKAVESATDNGFTQDGTTTWVTPTSPSTGVFQVLVRRNLPTTFSSVMGFQAINVAGRAVADCRSTSGEGFALFADGHNCDKQIEFAGQTNVINGAMHSNGNIHMSGGPNTFNGAVTYVDALEGSGSGNVYTPDHAPILDQERPVTFELAHFKAQAQLSPTDNMYFDTAGNINASYISARGDGLYYSTKKIDVGSIGSTPRNITLVSEEEVIISGSDLDLRPFPGMNNLLAFSGEDWSLTDRCSKEGVILNGSNNKWRGFIYAPESRVKLEGSTNNTLVGSVIAWSIYLSGQSLNNTADPAFFAGPAVLRLVE